MAEAVRRAVAGRAGAEHPIDQRPVTWAVSPALTGYRHALAIMETRAAAIAIGEAEELVWLLEHPDLFTAGTSAKPEHLIDAARFEVHQTGRGGQYTYHGPGQRVAYLMLDVRRRFGADVRGFVQSLEGWLIDTLGAFGIQGRTIPGRVGVWVGQADDELKIAALGVRIQRGVSLHGVSLNVSTDLSGYDGIVPCGIADRGVTSLRELGVAASMKDVDKALRVAFEQRFGAVVSGADPRLTASMMA